MTDDTPADAKTGDGSQKKKKKKRKKESDSLPRAVIGLGKLCATLEADTSGETRRILSVSRTHPAAFPPHCPPTPAALFAQKRVQA